MWKVKEVESRGDGYMFHTTKWYVFRFQNTAIWNEGSIFGCLQTGDSLIIEQ